MKSDNEKREIRIKNLKNGFTSLRQPSSEIKSKNGKNSRYWENLAVKESENEYDKIFQPFVVCDRICFKDGKIIFLEIKRNTRFGNKLSEKQKNLEIYVRNLDINI